MPSALASSRNNLNAPKPLDNDKGPRINMQSTYYPIGWPARIKFAPNWPSVTSRLGDIGYIDNSGSWRTVLNVLNSDQCHAHGIEPLLLSHDRSEYITQVSFKNSPEHPFVRVSNGWTFSLITDIELQRFSSFVWLLISSAEWEATSAPQSTQSRPQCGIEIKRSSNSAYRPLNALIAGPRIIARKLHLPEEIVKRWITLNWSKINAAINLYYQSYHPYARHRETCIALVEFVTETWTSVYEDGNTNHVEWLPIALGSTSTRNESQSNWDNIQLPKPTMRARFGMGNGQVYSWWSVEFDFQSEYVIGCDGLAVHGQLLKLWVLIHPTIAFCGKSKADSLAEPICPPRVMNKEGFEKSSFLCRQIPWLHWKQTQHKRSELSKSQWDNSNSIPPEYHYSDQRIRTWTSWHNSQL